MNIPIAQGRSISKYEFSCPHDCTSTWQNTLHVFGVFLHMHGWGSQIWGTHWRGDTLINETGRIDFWDFAFQQQLPVMFDILPGDRINTHCWYQQNPSAPVAFGLPSSDEMCIQYLQYYPRIPDNTGICGYFYGPLLASYGIDNTTVCNDDILYDTTGLPKPDTIKDPPLAITRYFGTEGTNSAFTCSSAAMNVPHMFSIVLFLLLLIV